MTLTLPPEIEQQINRLIHEGKYASVEAALVDAVKALVRDQERESLNTLLENSAISDEQIHKLMQEAEASGNYTELNAEDWADIEREGIAILNSRRSG